MTIPVDDNPTATAAVLAPVESRQTVRFAPSPSGYMHLGHAYSSLIAWHNAQASGSRFLLRIEDIDSSRCRPAFEQAIFHDLAWLGIDWQLPVRRQSESMSNYADS